MGDPPPAVRYRTDFDKQVLLTNFSSRHFKRASDHAGGGGGDGSSGASASRDWNFAWLTVGNVRALFHPESGWRLNDSQMVNHFPNHYELTRKDLMVKNLKKYRRELEKEGSDLLGNNTNSASLNAAEAAAAALIAQANGTASLATPTAAAAAASTAAAAFNYKNLDFFPLTYTMPSDYSVFVEDFKRNPTAVWIMKPNGKSQGKGITIISKMAQLKKWYAAVTKQTTAGAAGGATGGAGGAAEPTLKARDSYVVSRYIENPLLIGGKKFDLR